MLLPSRTFTSEYTVKRSRFITSLRRCGDEDAARTFISSIRREYADARHNCTAFTLGQGAGRSCDDGEPAGTAGMPMLQALTGRGVDYACAVVTRYFGGIKLGAGGLVRAYSHAVTSGLDAAQLVERVRLATTLVTVPAQTAGALYAALAASPWTLAAPRWGENTVLTVTHQPTQAGAVRERVMQLTRGVADVRGGDDVFVERPVLVPNPQNGS